jgi:flagellar biosynthetic protein FlhB
MAGEKTEAPTPRRRDEARAKGQGIGRSSELSMGMTLGVGMVALSSLLPGVASTLITKTQNAIVDMSPHTSTAELEAQTGGVFMTVLTLVLPLACIVMIAGVAANLVSGGLVFSYRAVRFDLSRINPLQGMKRIVDKQALVRLGLASAKLAILTVISWQIVGSRIPTIVNSEGSSATIIAGTCLAAIFQLGLTITILLAVVALVDFVVQRRKAQQSIRMSKEDIKQEYKESEGNPLIRGARRRRARQMAFARMMDAVPTSDVIVTNPTTLAVALKYDSLTMRAPKIVAKGQRLMADRIKQIAREHNVPVIEDKPLARALFARPIGSEVPAHLYRAVARLLVLVHQARFNAASRQGGGRSGAQGWNPGQAQGAPGGFGTRPWWSAEGSSEGMPDSTAEAAAGGTLDSSAAARLYGGASGTTASEDASDGDILDETLAATSTPVDQGFAPETDPDEAWLDGAALTLDDVDEEALAVAMAEDELGDVTAAELAQLEAGLVLGDDPIDPDLEEQER